MPRAALARPPLVVFRPCVPSVSQAVGSSHPY